MVSVELFAVEEQKKAQLTVEEEGDKSECCRHAAEKGRAVADTEVVEERAGDQWQSGSKNRAPKGVGCDGRRAVHGVRIDEAEEERMSAIVKAVGSSRRIRTS